MKPPIIRTADDDFAWKEYHGAFLALLPQRERRALEAWCKTFYDFQLAWLFEPEDFAASVKARQIGFSHTTAAATILWAVFLSDTSTVISVGEREAKEVLDKAKQHAALLRDFGSKWATVRGKDAAEEVRFSSGGRVIALPQTSGGRSFSGNVFLDEFAYVQNSKQLWDGALAVTQHGYKARIASTPNGVGNDFHGLISKPEQHAGWALHEIPIQRAIDAGMRVDLGRCWKMAKGDPRIFDQLFNCKFLDGDLQYIPTELVNRCSVDDLYTWEGDFFAGLDIGRTNDLTALIVVRLVGDTAKLVSLKTCKRTDQDALDALVDGAFQSYGLRRLAVDSTGIGAFPAEAMQKKHGSHRVEPVTFTLGSKEDLATTTFQFFKTGQVQIPKTDDVAHDCETGGADALRQDVCSIQRIVTPAGNIRYDAPHTDDGHADRAWALALALYATGKKPSLKFVDATR